jgi:hypothetical protein
MRARGAELKARFGAHSLGIGRKRVAGRRTGTLALIFYVARKDHVADPVPDTIAFTPSGHSTPVELPTDVIETPRVEPSARE